MASMVSTNCMLAHQLAEFLVSKSRRDSDVKQTCKILQVMTYDVLVQWTLIYTVVVSSPYRRMFQESLACPFCILFLSGSMDGSPYPNLNEAPIGASFGPGVLESVPSLNCLNSMSCFFTEAFGKLSQTRKSFCRKLILLAAVFTAYPSQTSPIHLEFNTPSDGQSVCLCFVALPVNQSKGRCVACNCRKADHQNQGFDA